MNIQLPYIKCLLVEVENYHARPIRTTVDFEALSITVEQQTSERISASTLKRLWGYVNDKHEPRRYTLDVLAKYIGYKHFEAYCEWINSQDATGSDFFCSKKILSSDLTYGATVEIGWSPNRYLLLSYMGNNLYKVKSAKNSKLVEDDEFTVVSFMLGYPLYIPSVVRDEEHLPSFVGGKDGGLTILSIL